MTEDVTNLVLQIEGGITEVAGCLKSEMSCRVWTRMLLKVLGEIGERNGYYVAPKFSDDVRSVNEWMYDLIWYKEDESGVLLEVGMVLESEWLWRTWDICYDFQKLLVAKAGIKVFVTENNKKAKEQCVANIRFFEPHDMDAIYLFALYENDHFVFEVYDSAGGLLPE